jgi:hypothetical protein
MSTTTVTISGPIVLENPRTYGHSTRNLEFDGQLWLGPNNTITGEFRYYNEEDVLFDEINYCIAWIHVFFFSFLSYNSSTLLEQIAKATHVVEKSSSTVVEQNSVSEMITDERHVNHIYGDIVPGRVRLSTAHAQESSYIALQLMNTTVDCLRYRPYITVSGVASNCNDEEAFFDVSASQYISLYKTEPQFWTFPVRASFKGPKYRNKKPMPYNNISVCVEGLLAGMELDKDTGEPSFFHVLVDNIGFLGKPFLPKHENNDRGMHFFSLQFRLTNH